jgi:hypothetical protein
MYIFAGTFQASPGKGAEAAEAVAKLRDAAKAATGEPVWGWRSIGAGPFGAFGVSTRVESIAQLIQFQQTTAGSADFVDASAELGALLAAPAEITVNRIVAATGAGEPKQFITITNAAIAGQMSKVMAWSNGVLEGVTKVTGTGGALTVPASGNVLSVSWIFGSDSPDEMDENTAKLDASEEYTQMLDEAEGMFVDGSVSRMLLAQLP